MKRQAAIAVITLLLASSMAAYASNTCLWEVTAVIISGNLNCVPAPQGAQSYTCDSQTANGTASCTEDTQPIHAYSSCNTNGTVSWKTQVVTPGEGNGSCDYPTPCTATSHTDPQIITTGCPPPT
jgi:hypothetical protein